MKKVLKFALKAVKWCFVVFLLYVASLFFRAQDIPGEWVERAFAAAVEGDDLVFHCDSASFGFRRGLRLNGLRLYYRKRLECLEPVASAQRISIHFLERLVVVRGAKCTRLHDGYYEEGSYAEPLGDGPLDFRFPNLGEFRLVLERPAILGVAPQRVDAMVRVSPTRVDCSPIRLDWVGDGGRTGLDGACLIELGVERRVKGMVRGLATQSQIRPLIDVLDIPVVLPYMDAFTMVASPVPATCSWDVNLVDNDFNLSLDLSPTLGKYNGVSLDRAAGKISLHVTFPEDRMDYTTRIGPVSAIDRKGRRLDGTIEVQGVGDVVHLVFDAKSELPLKALLDVIGYLNEGELGALSCDTPPRVEVSGVLAADAEHQPDNDLRGKFSFEKGALFGIPLGDAAADFSYIGDCVAFTNAFARCRRGGTVTGAAALRFPGLVAEKATFAVDLAYHNGSIEELGDLFDFDIGDKSGTVSGRVSLSGPLATNAVERLAGSGEVRVTNGHLAQMRLFAGLTELLAREVPGVEKIVNQSEGSSTFTIERGVFRSDDIRIEGTLFSISAAGAYDIARDSLDFTVRVRLMRDDSVLGKYLIRPILWPFTKLLMEFKVGGSLAEPKWEYISVLDRIR